MWYPLSLGAVFLLGTILSLLGMRKKFSYRKLYIGLVCFPAAIVCFIMAFLYMYDEPAYVYIVAMALLLPLNFI